MATCNPSPKGLYGYCFMKKLKTGDITLLLI